MMMIFLVSAVLGILSSLIFGTVKWLILSSLIFYNVKLLLMLFILLLTLTIQNDLNLSLLLEITYQKYGIWYSLVVMLPSL